jgi:DMSO/TMAO reductase YedYZ molybdopterin-dependent catalytic subunit
MTREQGTSLRAATSLWVLCSLASPGHNWAQEPVVSPSTGIVLRIEGLVDKPLGLSAADLARMPRQTLEARDRDGKLVRFAGVTLTEVLRAAGGPLGEKLRGTQLSKFLLVEAADGYRVVFALPELDPAFTDESILIADRRDGQPLSAAEGPLRLVVLHEKRQARWVRQVTTLRVLLANP